ncbi:MAG TPA: hypothetical protein DCQ28_07900, partial [Bacteroidetes bacterium]|nr:hypothetical protein [Bacteroidota bacterium]
MKHLFEIAFLGFVFIIFCIAQPPDNFGEGKKRPYERLERYKKVQMVEVLKLDEETGLKLITRYNN